VRRRHQRERFALDRRFKALGRLEVRELRSLENAVRRQVQEMEAAREQKAETLQDRIEVNKLDSPCPRASFMPRPRNRNRRAGRRGRKS